MQVDPCVDKKLSLSLSNGKPQLAADMLSTLLAELAQTHSDISNAFAELRLDDALELIHKLHGNCCYCGVTALKAACKKLEAQLHRQRHLPAPDDLRQFNEAVKTLLAWQQTHDIATFFAS
jgi:two-component system, NarL family, sensor histidine kinase BarA